MFEGRPAEAGTPTQLGSRSEIEPPPIEWVSWVPASPRCPRFPYVLFVVAPDDKSPIQPDGWFSHRCGLRG